MKKYSGPGHSKLFTSKLAPAKILQPDLEQGPSSVEGKLESAEFGAWKQADDVEQSPIKGQKLPITEDSTQSRPKDLLVQLREELSRTVREKFNIDPHEKNL